MFHDGKKDIIKYVFIAVVVLAVILIIVSQNRSEESSSETSSFEVETTESGSVEVVTSAVSEDKTETATESSSEEVTEEDPEDNSSPVSDNEEEYTFRNNKLLEEHYEKHGEDMGFDSAEDYEQAASDVVTNPEALHKTEKEDGDDVYYVEDTNEFVVVSTDGYIRTYFYPSSGKKYYDNQ